MHNSDLVTVICTCYNHEKYVVESLQSVIDQTYKNIQLIVIDDCSTDKSALVITTYLQRFPEVIFIRNKINLGLTKSVNNAIPQAKGTYFIDLAADDILLPQCVATQMAGYNNTRYKNVAIVYCNAEQVLANGQHLSFYFDVDANHKATPSRPSGPIYKRVISTETVICSVAALYKMSVFKQLNLYDATLCYEDYDYWIRATRNYDVEYVDEIVIKKRIIPNSLHHGFEKNHRIIGKSTYKILKKATALNRIKEEDKILSQSVVFEIKKSIKQLTLILLIKNCWLWISLQLRY